MDVKKYAPTHIDEMVSKCDHLSNNEREFLKKLLLEFGPLFDGTLVGTWNTYPIDLQLKDLDVKPYHARPYPLCPNSRSHLPVHWHGRSFSTSSLRPHLHFAQQQATHSPDPKLSTTSSNIWW
jgi:hypothetical protein